MKANKLTAIAMLLAVFLTGASKAKAQTNAQILYDFGSDRKYVTLTLEMFKQDKWGSTYFFVDHDFNYDKMTTETEELEPARRVQRWHHQGLPYQQRMAVWR